MDMSLREVREKAGISQLELARRARMAPSDLSRIEHGRFTVIYPGWRRRLAEALNIPENELFEEVTNNGDRTA
jgi:transcriptional regulator with XRE-family HTH domain